MAEKRMFTKKITDSDAFIELSSSAQALYFHLNQGADDDGFNNQIQNAMFKSHATIDDLKVLMLKNFIIRFESGVIVIKHWRIHNTLRKDRYTPTNFQEELKMLNLKDNGAYTLKNIDGCQVVAKWLPQNSIDKNSIDKNSIDKNSIDNNEQQQSDDGDIAMKTIQLDDDVIVSSMKECVEKGTLYTPSTKSGEKQYQEEFEKLWAYYPNKKSKKQAENKYILARKNGTTYETIAKGLKNYLDYIKREKIDIKFVKHGSTWFNQECWNDDYPISNNVEQKSHSDKQWDVLKGVYNGTIKINQ